MVFLHFIIFLWIAFDVAPEKNVLGSNLVQQIPEARNLDFDLQGGKKKNTKKPKLNSNVVAGLRWPSMTLPPVFHVLV